MVRPETSGTSVLTKISDKEFCCNFLTQYTIQLGGIVFRIFLERPVKVERSLDSFLISDLIPADIMVTFSWDWENAEKPTSEVVGRNLFQAYYLEKEKYFCVAPEDDKGWLACARYTPEYDQISCWINEKPFIKTPERLGTFFRFLPMLSIFQHYDVLFFHAAQILTNGKGILFTAPSGTGKTTQAKLWCQYEGAELICNDRTLVRRTEEGWSTYGYPIDGSQPVHSEKICPLGAVVLLEKSSENSIKRLTGSRAVARLLPQMVIDTWNGEARLKAMDDLFRLLEEIPVYLLKCTPDKRAVDCLKQKLTEEGVILNGNNP